MHLRLERSFLGNNDECLQIDGAAWRDNRIVLEFSDLAATGPAVAKNVALTFNIRSTLSEKHSIDIPLYSNSSRSLLISTVQVTCTSPREDIVLAGVAFYSSD